MGRNEQSVLVEIAEQPRQPALERCGERRAAVKLRAIHREQMMLAHIHIDELIGMDHKARAIRE